MRIMLTHAGALAWLIMIDCRMQGRLSVHCYEAALAVLSTSRAVLRGEGLPKQVASVRGEHIVVHGRAVDFGQSIFVGCIFLQQGEDVFEHVVDEHDVVRVDRSVFDECDHSGKSTSVQLESTLD